MTPPSATVLAIYWAGLDRAGRRALARRDRAVVRRLSGAGYSLDTIIAAINYAKSLHVDRSRPAV